MRVTRSTEKRLPASHDRYWFISDGTTKWREFLEPIMWHGNGDKKQTRITFDTPVKSALFTQVPEALLAPRFFCLS